jgi:hypothetical protein
MLCEEIVQRYSPDVVVQNSLQAICDRLIFIYIEDAKTAFRARGDISWKDYKSRRLNQVIKEREFNRFPEETYRFLVDRAMTLSFSWAESNGKSHAIYQTYSSILGRDLQGILIRDDGFSEAVKEMLQGQTEERKMAFVNQHLNLRQSIQHELTHAFDDWKTNGDYANNKATGTYEKNKDDVKLYRKQPLEINAAFRQKLAAAVGGLSWDLYKTLFVKYYDGFADLSPKVQKRLLTRLYRYWDQHHRHSEPEPPDPTEA